MQIIKTIASLRQHVTEFRVSGDKVGLVPTMGNLHQGHLDLVTKASAEADRVIVSIFVNPTQFDQADDLAAYPRTLEADFTALELLGVDAVFTPEPSEMYPQGGLVTEIDVPSLTQLHEGSSRQGHFKGVATVVCKLFNCVTPDVAVFGQKDFQQLALIRQMVADLDMPIKIIGLPTVRESDGLAMSSRNSRLTVSERKVAPHLYQVLRKIEGRLKSGVSAFQALEVEATEELSASGLKPDYFQICHARTLLPASEGDKDLVILAAVFLGKVRLIDNLQLSLND